MSYQPPGSIQSAIANGSWLVGSGNTTNGAHSQLINSTIPASAIGAIFRTFSGSYPQDTETLWAWAEGFAYLDLSTNTLYKNFTVWGKNTGEYTATSVALSAGSDVTLVESSYIHNIQIENYGGGAGKALEVWAEDLSVSIGTASVMVAVEFVEAT